MLQCNTEASCVGLASHPVANPTPLKDEAWFLEHLRDIMQGHFSDHQARVFYLFEEQ